jgi:hypothetical protein
VLGYRANRSVWRVVVPISLVNSGMTQAQQIEYTAALSVAAFCHVIHERAGLST